MNLLFRHCFFQLFGGPLFRHCFLFSFFKGLQASGGISCLGIMSGDAFLSRIMTIFIKAYICGKVELVTTTVEKSNNNYVEWYFQSAQRLNVSRLYAGTMVIHCIHCIHCIHRIHRIHCIHWLSASKMTCVWVISVKADFCLGYQFRK